MDLHMKSNPAKGAYALVFFDKEHGRAFKLFKTSAWDDTIQLKCEVKVEVIRRES